MLTPPPQKKRKKKTAKGEGMIVSLTTHKRTHQNYNKIKKFMPGTQNLFILNKWDG